MKKQIIFGAIAVLASVSCSKDVVVSENRDADVIRYGIVTNAATKAADTYCNSNLPAKFYVSARTTTGAKTYFVNDEITVGSGGVCTQVGNTRYWPTENLDFFAHVNAGTTFTWAEAEAPKFVDFTVADGAASQVDLMYAVDLNNAKPNPNSNVSLNFRHALSQVVFNAKNTNERLYVEIDEVVVCGVNSKGTYTFNVATGTDSQIVDNNHDGDGTYEMAGRGNWATSTPIDYTVKCTGNKTVGIAYNETQSLTNSNTVDKNEHALMLIPTTSTSPAKWNPTTDTKPTGAYFKVKCTIYNVAGAKYNETTDLAVWGAKGKTEYVYIPADLTWNEGYKFVYTFVFGDGNGGFTQEGNDALIPIKYEVTADEFVATPAQDVNMKK